MARPLVEDHISRGQALPADAPHAMELPLSEGVYEWRRPKRQGQVVRHYITARHGIVLQTEGPDMPAGK